MRLVLLTNFVPPYRRELYAAMTRLFPDLKILVSTYMETNRSWKVDHSGLSVVKQKTISVSRNWKHNTGFKEKLPIHFPTDTAAQLKEIQPDAVISVELGYRSLMAMKFCEANRVPFILWVALSEHTEMNRGALRNYLRKKLLSKAVAVFCNGKSSERYIRSMGFNKKVHFVPYTSDYSINAAPNYPQKVRKLFYCGQLNPRKGVYEMLQAIKELINRNPKIKFELIVAGEGPEKNHVEELALLSQVELSLVGRMEYEELKGFYCEADLFLFPTLADEWGVVVNEALSSGLAVIGSKYSQAVEELVEEGKNGWVFDPLDQESFIRALEVSLSISDEDLMTMKRNATASIVGFDPEAVALNIQKAVLDISN